MTDRWMTRTEAADTLGVSTKTIDRYVLAGLLTKVTINARVTRISADSLDKLQEYKVGRVKA